MDDVGKKGLIDLTGFDEIKKSIKENDSESEFITQFEFGKWMIEGKGKFKLIFFINFSCSIKPI